jgi:hypothetical protein
MTSLDELRLKDTSARYTGESLYTSGHTAANDGGGGNFRYDAGSTATDNNGTIVTPVSGVGRYFRIIDGFINPRWFGAVGDGVTDDTAAFIAAIALAIADSKSLFVPNGTYKITATLDCVDGTSSLLIYNESQNGVVYLTSLTGTTPLFSFVGANDELQGAGVTACTVSASSPGPTGARNSGTAFYASGVIGVRFAGIVREMTCAVHLHNDAVGSYTEAVEFDVWSRYCDTGLRFQVTSGDASFHACGGKLKLNIWSSQVGINVGASAYWYNFNVDINAWGSDVSPQFLQLDGIVSKGNALWRVEHQATNAMTIAGSGRWEAFTQVFHQGAFSEFSTAVSLPYGEGLVLPCAGGTTKVIPSQYARRTLVAADASITLTQTESALVLITARTAGLSALLIHRPAANEIIQVSDQDSIIETLDPGSGTSKLWVRVVGGAITITNRFAVDQSIDLLVFGFL